MPFGGPSRASATRRTFATAKLADAFRWQLLQATREGVLFEIANGLPVTMRAAQKAMSWFDFACEFVDAKWAQASARHRRGHAEALTDLTLVAGQRDEGDA